MSTMTTVDKIINNLRDRRGFDQAFDVDDDIFEEIRQEMTDTIDAFLRESTQPIPMILHCPSCHAQHIDAPEKDKVFYPEGAHRDGPQVSIPAWDNPPHRSHLCHNCGTIWRPADVPTTGVEKIQTEGKNDIDMPAPVLASARVLDAEVTALKNLAYDMRQQAGNNNRLTHIGWAQRIERVISMLAAAPKE